MNTAIAEAEELTAQVEALATAAAEGAIVELGGLDGRVQLVCEAVLGLPPGTAAGARPVMEALLAALDRLQAAMEAERVGAPPESPAPLPTDGSARDQPGPSDSGVPRTAAPDPSADGSPADPSPREP